MKRLERKRFEQAKNNSVQLAARGIGERPEKERLNNRE